jgi:ribosomal protein S12 methylthiotransferase accessory factor YcaO
MLKVDGIERSVPAAETALSVAAVAESLGVTRLADITGLDRIGIPVYSSIVPDSADNLSVHNGKGLRPVDAKAGALMEAIERKTALKARLPIVEDSFRHLSQIASVLNPRTINYELAANYSDDRTYSWCEGREISSGESCWVPAKLAGFNWYDVRYPATFVMTDTNGLASGNTRDEAICHALCELVRRTLVRNRRAENELNRRIVNDLVLGRDHLCVWATLVKRCSLVRLCAIRRDEHTASVHNCPNHAVDMVVTHPAHRKPNRLPRRHSIEPRRLGHLVQNVALRSSGCWRYR